MIEGRQGPLVMSGDGWDAPRTAFIISTYIVRCAFPSVTQRCHVCTFAAKRDTRSTPGEQTQVVLLTSSLHEAKGLTGMMTMESPSELGAAFARRGRTLDDAVEHATDLYGNTPERETFLKAFIAEAELHG